MDSLLLNQLLQPSRVWRRSELLSRPSPIPKLPGLYAWYFQNIPPRVPISDCVIHNGLALLYLGIAPSGLGSKRTLPDRLRDHLAGNAYGSTLRLSLGCLLEEELGIRLQQVGKNRLTFGEGEATLSAWIDNNAFIAWFKHPKPWEVEAEVVKNLSLPLNLEHNEGHPFYPVLSGIRRAVRTRARSTMSG